MAKQRIKSPLTKIIKNIGPKIPTQKKPGTNIRPSKSRNIA